MSLQAVVNRSRAYYCLECGICTGSCPISRYSASYSPRIFVERALLFDEMETLSDEGVWSCLTCGTCNSRCPSGVDYTEFMQEVRQRARKVGMDGVCTHAATLSALFELQKSPYFRKPTSWLGKNVKIRSRGDTYYFGGCLPFLSVIFKEIGFDGTQIGHSAVRLLNKIGIVPVVSEEEVCCGHDAYWTGETELAKEFAQRNIRLLKRLGVKRVIFSCPECYYMFKYIYPELLGKVNFEVVHILSLLSDNSDRLGRRSYNKKVTYHDPCRLARYDSIIEEPRSLLSSIDSITFDEMERSGTETLCCGSSNWVSCSRVNKKIQVERLEEAIATGAEVLVTSCPKCNIHLRCALHDGDIERDIEIKDILTLLRESLGGGRGGT